MNIPPIPVALILALLSPSIMEAQPSHYALESLHGLRLLNVKAATVTHDGKRAVRLTSAARPPAGPSADPIEKLAIIEASDFSNGVIEAEIAGAPEAGAIQAARGFVGIAFRVQPDGKTYDAFYLRPTNGRADDQVRRNHSAQYISHPDWTWVRFRKEAPEKYESYVDLVPGAWTTIRIEVRGSQARLFVHGAPQPTLIVNDLKTGAASRGAIALWIDVGTEAHFRNIRVTPQGPRGQ
jgi:hypothetical protein